MNPSEYKFSSCSSAIGSMLFSFLSMFHLINVLYFLELLGLILDKGKYVKFSDISSQPVLQDFGSPLFDGRGFVILLI